MYAMVVDKHYGLIVVCVNVVDAIEVSVAILQIVYPSRSRNHIMKRFRNIGLAMEYLLQP